MIELVKRKRIDILIDAPLSEWLAETAAAAGIPHHTLMNLHSGKGRSGSWRDEDVSGAVSKRMFIAIANEAKVSALIEALAPHLDTYGLVMTIADVEVVRGERF
jgi:nitrogen regulatory protein PII